ncbi:Gfo/Idh/MocA family protein [Novipirellula artificiosorum]|uniref:Inositol 2-dehydrogenase n=1 Tax=Novipirellula artificiosorum TaxID=2528016 RepID=A0A5C6CW59_9BACT|nr:Gfo/Idh/MocA family oxidoreductase [Novipirellula artificiosorum]TWU28790.1 Inositol 2-dehydrogenase [Novipirellula artificiosorum]
MSITNEFVAIATRFQRTTRAGQSPSERKLASLRPRRPMTVSRRDFLRTAAASAAMTPYFWTSHRVVADDKNSRLRLGMIGCGGKGRDDSKLASEHGDFVAVCDVDRGRAERYAANPALNGDGQRKLDVYTDHRELLARDDIDVVICATPDHWHTPIYVDALLAGKHVYGEKPMTLTIDEVKVLRKAVAKSGCTLQVGNQQRSCQWFREAIAIAQSGILGDNLTATCYLGKGNSGGPFQVKPVPKGLDWDRWLGQTPLVPYISQRCHGSFRWWYEYSGGKLTDWGAHHLDIAQWALGAIGTGPVEIEGSGVHDSRENCFNTAQTFRGTLKFENGTRLIFEDGGEKTNGILLQGDRERIFVNRGKLVGNLVNKITADPKWNKEIRDAAGGLYDGPYGLPDVQLNNYANFGEFDAASWTGVKQSHMGNLFHCIKTGQKPISDVVTVGNSTIACHLANIGLRLERKLRWDPNAERFIGDDEANAMMSRKQREGYEIKIA